MATATTRLESPYGSLELQRYPARRPEPLQAWCSADLLLLEAAQAEGLDASTVGVVNDDHGALSLSLQAAWLWTDSALAQIAVAANAKRNQRQPAPLYWSTQEPPSAAAVVLRIPKQLPYLEYQLATLAASLPAGSLLLAAGMDKHLSPHTASLIERYFGPCTRHRGRRKARLFSARNTNTNALARPGWSGYHCELAGGELRALPNVFCRDGLDIGSRFLLQQLPQMAPIERLADLACGNGVLGISAMQAGLCSELSLCDESAMAIASARDNAHRLLPAASKCHFFHGDGLQGVSNQQDLILCNPPFHLGHTVDEYAGRRLLASCAQLLTATGSLCLVANRHLEYRPVLRRHFKVVEQLAANRKFVVWLASRG